MVAGNVETSQCVTDALYGALGVMAASQGTMNNFTFGNDALPVLRDDLPAARARAPGFDGTDVRADAHDQLAPHRSRSARVALPGAARELRDPRAARAARAAWRGGDGAMRRVRFLEPMTAAILSGHRMCRRTAWQAARPATSAATTSSARKARASIAGADKTEMNAGDVFVIETPGGGGYGKP